MEENMQEFEEKQTFIVEDENGESFVAELLTIIEVENIEYAVYSIDRNDEDTDVYVARVGKDEEGNDTIVTIEDEEERNRVFDIVQRMIDES